MIIVAILGYMFISVLDAGIFGGLLAFLLSRRGNTVSVRALAVGVLIFVVCSDAIMFAIVAPLDLTLTTGNRFLTELFGSSDLSDILQPSFDLFDIAFYALDVVVGVCIGKLVLRWKKPDFPTTASTPTNEPAAGGSI
jgi:hypothetical protein